ncbi:MAG: hypothetical protein ACREMO_07015, partial [Gemmatimonadales bacterium]
AQVYVDDTGTEVFAGSRTKWIAPEDDNFGFARWVQANREELLKLGPGSHFGEWWGSGIQRGYGLREKRFSLFNVVRWDVPTRPACCGVVPTLFRGNMDALVGPSDDPMSGCPSLLHQLLHDLRVHGSRAVPGFMKPEGLVIYHVAAGVGFKKTLDKDDVPKSLAGAP